ncbi:Rrf2 family nitric oxide-sensitive transcriptional repressor [Novosphingobium chloroacetimidivorans]|uniref:Rrf2 family nitric oxide-sensitive transcriptional repressor n=1 Tax=Novosphingobium chloroacetimidivorans TaxID=1428314 RepID=A0A7W7K9R6_9SPHN|nr:Rrf2 family transcriptional regulator [Novosphingobium chloroacetimidivorans]MBB4858600.1 Rrf2 family nitric oxide-sensitive transcriptional repressor [Novosphingobium chloroacetimidivorans]
MQLTRYTDYAIRVLLHVGARDEGSLSSISEIAKTYDISKSHLMKVVQDLGQAGFLTTVRGRTGGLKLGRDAKDITIGEVVRHTEQGFDLVDCSSCIIAPACGLPNILSEATRAFLAVLDRYTLSDVLSRRADLRGLFGGFQPLKKTIKRVADDADSTAATTTRTSADA